MISRPFALVGLSFTLALAVLNLIDGASFVLVLFALCSLVVCIFCKGFERRGVYSVVCLSILLACSVFGLYESYIYSPALELVGREKEVLAQIVSLPVKGTSSWNYILKVEQIDGAACSGKLLFSVENPLDASAYDRISFVGRINSIENYPEDLTAYYKAKGVYWQCADCTEYKISPCTKKPFGYWLLEAKEYIRDRFAGLMQGDSAGLAIGMLTGDTDLLSDSAYSDFRRSGLSHVLAVSGMHMSIIVLSLYKLLCGASRRYVRLWAAICMSVAVFYAGISGFSQSVVRSCIMVCILFAGKLISKRADTLNSLGLAAFVIAFLGPYAVVDWSFMLSFSATLGIVLTSKYINRFCSSLCGIIRPLWLAVFIRKALNAMGIAVAATVFCLPVTVFFIGRISLVFLPANLLTMYAVSAVLILSLICVVPMGFVSDITAFVCSELCDYLLNVTDWLSGFRYASVSVDNGFSKLTLAAALIAVAAAIALIKNRALAKRICIAALSGAVVLTAVYGCVMETDRVDISYTASCVVVSKSQDAVVIGCDGNALKSAESILYNKGCENVILLLPQTVGGEEINKAQRFFSKYNVENVILSKYSDVLAFTKQYEITDRASFDFYNTKITFASNYCTVEAKSGRTKIILADNGVQNTDADYIIRPTKKDKSDELNFSYNKFGVIKGGEEVGGFD